MYCQTNSVGLFYFQEHIDIIACQITLVVTFLVNVEVEFYMHGKSYVIPMCIEVS